MLNVYYNVIIIVENLAEGMSLSNLNPEERLNHIRTQNRARASKYYELHKAQIAQKAKERRRQKIKSILDGHNNPTNLKPKKNVCSRKIRQL
jgi:hypothetical protein